MYRQLVAPDHGTRHPAPGTCSDIHGRLFHRRQVAP